MALTAEFFDAVEKLRVSGMGTENVGLLLMTGTIHCCRATPE